GAARVRADGAHQGRGAPLARGVRGERDRGKPPVRAIRGLARHRRRLMLPNFLIIGAQKSGTTSLYRYLQMHPDVFMPRNKEPDFFVAERNWPMGLDWYEAHFAAARDAIAIGEASTTYTMYPHYAGVPERV